MESELSGQASSLVLERDARIPLAAELPSFKSPLAGRDREIAELRQLLANQEAQLVTLTGPGGVGKTRLAVETARTMQALDAEVVIFVSFTSLRDPGLALTQIASTFAIDAADDPYGAIVETLRRRPYLLLLDNLEHMLDLAPTIANLLDDCPELSIIATSREPLRLQREVVMPIEPLTLAPNTEQSAIALFTERVQAVAPDFVLNDANREIVASICRRLDGMPLALELAAARCGDLSVAELNQRLSTSLSILEHGEQSTTAHHRTLRDSIAWSYDLLSADEQRIFRSLAIFADGFSLETATAVVLGAEQSRSMQLLDAISSLLDKSLIRFDTRISHDGSVRFTLLETIREFALDQLVATGEDRGLRLRFVEWCIAFMDAVWPPPHIDAVRTRDLDRIETELGNLRAALAWLEQEEDALRFAHLCGALLPFWMVRSHRYEGYQWSLRAASLPAPENASTTHATVLLGVAILDPLRDESPLTIDRATTALGLFEAGGDRLGSAVVLNLLCMLHRARTELDLAKENGKAAEARLLPGDSESFRAIVHCNIGITEFWLGNRAAAVQRISTALSLYRSDENQWGQAFALHDLSLIAIDQGDQALAALLLANAIELCTELGARESLIDDIAAAGLLAFSCGQPEVGVAFIGAAETLASAVRYRFEAPLNAHHHQAIERARRRLGESTVDRIWRDAGHAEFEPQVERVRAWLTALTGTQRAPGPKPRSKHEIDALTAREREVLALLAQGRSDRQIGEVLQISPRTAMSHVANILAKLNLSSRTALVAHVNRG